MDGIKKTYSIHLCTKKRPQEGVPPYSLSIIMLINRVNQNTPVSLYSSSDWTLHEHTSSDLSKVSYLLIALIP